ncbi:MAG: hypothetical protein WC264_02645 [Candidatus Paceibacterota bacterium]|jgi:hypothetical protein
MEELKTKSEFEQKKSKYFISLGFRVREVLELHKLYNLWGEKDTKEDWRNVSEHCLVEVGRVKKFAEILNFSEETKNNLILAAGVHDFYKRYEVEETAKAGRTWDSYEKVSKEGTEKMYKAGLSPKVIYLANAPGHYSSLAVMEVLNHQKLSENDIAFLVMHYVDDYTIGSDWAKKGQLELRIQHNEANSQYTILNEEGRRYYNGKTTFETQREVNKIVAEKLLFFLQENSQNITDSEDIPLFIDEKIKEEIEKI